MVGDNSLCDLENMSTKTGKPDRPNILVTGGAGYIGSHVVKLLCDHDYPVRIIDNFSTGREENVDPRATLLRGDVLNSADLGQAFSKPIDVVFHFAALKAAGESMTDPHKFAVSNIWGSICLLGAMLEHGVSNIVFSSSAAVYGNPKYLPIDEKHPVKPTNYYGYTKLAIEENLKWYSQLKGIRYAALRYYNATGYDLEGKILGQEYSPTNLSPIVMEVAAGMRARMEVYGTDYDTRDGTCIRDYIHVDDLAVAHLKAMDYLLEKNKNLLVNLGTGQGDTVLEVIKAAEKATGNPIPYDTVAKREGDPGELYANPALAKELLGWEAKHSDLDTIFKSMCPVYLK